ncbi:hypothetical protein [Anaerospora sp.]|uniref:hypothetical protein n=1 Tax=Anaerospora sp. TaxID=1960278 RepID=UPI00289FE199|nr:hypothetical protein [Anaerospora sp.]
MNCIREAENYLRYYRELNQSLGHADRMINKIKWQCAPRALGAVNMDVTGVRADKPVNTLNQMYQLQKWQEMRERTQAEIDKIEAALMEICVDPGCERYRDILYMWYVDKRDKEGIAEETGYSRRAVFYLRKSAIKKFSVALFGFEALQAI